MNLDIQYNFNLDVSTIEIGKFSPWVSPYNVIGSNWWNAVLPYGDGYIGLTRLQQPNYGNCILLKILYDSEFNVIDGPKPIVRGEDPRLFMFNNKPYAWSYHPGTPDGKNPIQYFLIDIETEEIIILNIPFKYHMWFDLGKNWSPIVIDNELFIIVRLDISPIILRYKGNGNCEWVKGFEPNDTPIKVNEYRGGTPFIYNKEKNIYFGFGHRTFYENPSLHRPYLYTISKDFKQIFIDDKTIKTDNINDSHFTAEDPSAIFEKNGKYYFSSSFMDWKFPHSRNINEHGKKFYGIDKKIAWNGIPVWGYGYGVLYEVVLN